MLVINNERNSFNLFGPGYSVYGGRGGRALGTPITLRAFERTL